MCYNDVLGLHAWNACLPILTDEETEDKQAQVAGKRRHDSMSKQEGEWRSNSHDYEARFCGHCNTTTDIKEANFFGRYWTVGT